jgi:citrate lyase beta subunit
MKSLLYVYPSVRATNKLGGAVPDLVVVDLEEAVAASDKGKARDRLRETTEAIRTHGLRMVVRVNGADTAYMADDLVALDGLDPQIGLLLPKPLDAAVVGEVAALHPERTLWLMAESRDTPSWLPAVLGAQRVAGLVIGGKDLSLDLGLGDYAPDDASLRAVIAQVAAIARPHDLDVFDGVVAAEREVLNAAARARASGCNGLSFIDPSHISALGAETRN